MRGPLDRARIFYLMDRDTSVIHVQITTAPGGTVHFQSPELPGLLFGRGSIDEMRGDLAGVLRTEIPARYPELVKESLVLLWSIT